MWIRWALHKGLQPLHNNASTPDTTREIGGGIIPPPTLSRIICYAPPTTQRGVEALLQDSVGAMNNPSSVILAREKAVSLAASVDLLFWHFWINKTKNSYYVRISEFAVGESDT